MSQAQYTPVEYSNMHLIYGQCRGDANKAAALYRERYPKAHHPDHRVFITVHNAYIKGQIPGDDEDVDGGIQTVPSTSTRSKSKRTGITKSKNNKILKLYRFHPYHERRVQVLLPRDYAARMVFCRRMLQKIQEDPNFFNKILWTEESTYRRDGYLNLHDLHSWQLEDPHLIQGNKSHQFEINYWTGILNGKVIGPFALPATLYAENYLNFLQNDLPDLLDDVSLESRNTMWLQNDGCPAHSSVDVRQYLHQVYPNRWIGRLGPILWPPRSPDLNPLQFFYWGCLKEKVYERTIASLRELRERVEAAAQEISERNYSSLLKKAFIRRCRACIRAGGQRFEYLL